MATQNLTRLNVALTASIGGFQKGFGAANKLAGDFGSTIRNSILSPMGALVSLLAGGSLLAGIKLAATRIDDLAKSADRLGITTQSLAGLRFAAEQTGASAEILDKGMAKLTKTVQLATQGNVEAKRSLEQLGLKTQDLAGKLPDQQFAAVADAVKGLQTQGERTAITMKLFGEEGVRLLNTLDAGSKGLAAMSMEAEQLGIAISRVDAAKVEEANDALNSASKVFLGIFEQAAVRIAPFVTAVAQAFTGAAKEANGFGSTLDNIVNFAVQAAGFIADAWQGLGIIWQAMRVGVAKIGLAVVELGDNAVSVAQWIGEKFVAAWDLVKSSFAVLGNTINLGWAALRIPVAEFVTYVGSQIANMLNTSANAIRRLDLDLAASLDNAAAAVRTSTANAAHDADRNFTAVQKSLSDSSAAVVANTNKLFASVSTTGSAAMQDLAEGFRELVAEEQNTLSGLLNQEQASVRFTALVTEIQTETQLRAEARAEEIAATQQQQADMAAAEATGIEARQSQWMQLYDWLNSQTGKYVQQTLGGFSSMFSNLSKLQESHSKTARRIGKIAAKSKIVTDTASAAMGAYSSLAAIPIVGPALGAAAAAAAVIAGGIQLQNVDRSDSGTLGPGPSDSSTGNVGGIATPPGAGSGQTLVLQGDSFGAESLVNIFKDAKERGYVIEGVRRA